MVASPPPPPHSKYTINSDTEPILPAAPIATNVAVTTNPFVRTLESTSVGTWFILHSLLITLILIPSIIAAKEGAVQFGIACYIFIILFAAFSKKISVLYVVVGMAVSYFSEKLRNLRILFLMILFQNC